MRLIDMGDYTPAARRVWIALSATGYLALGYAVLQVSGYPAHIQRQVLFGAVMAGVVGMFPVRLPGMRVALAAGEIFMFLALLLFGPAAATVTAAAEGCVASLRSTRRATSRIITPAVSSLAMLAASTWFEQARSGFGVAFSLGTMLPLIFGAALIHYTLGTLLIGTLLALKERRPIRPLTWLLQYGWMGLAYLASGSIAALLYSSHLQFGIETIAIAAPLVILFVAVCHFYIQRRAADERHMAELMASEARLQAALKKAEQASRAKTHFLAAASHDLRQPLHALSFLTAALDMRALDAGARDILRKMVNALDDLSLEFDMLLDISKLDAGVVPIRPGTFEIRPFLERIGEPFVAAALSRGLDFSVTGCEGVHVHTDRALLERIVRNIIDNAFKYTPRGSVAVSCGCVGARCEISIIDTGIGIPEAERERVFDEFYQLGNSERDRRKGMGLGLSIVRRLATLLCVELRMESTEGRGTTFTLALDAVAAPEVAQPRAPAISSRLRDRQVLLIDDEAAPREALRGYLEGLGCKVSVAASTEEAAAIALFEEPDIVLADFRLRDDATGLQAIHRLRQARPDLPAIIVTGDTAPERLAELEGTGLEVLYKPVAPARLVEAITARLHEVPVETA